MIYFYCHFASRVTKYWKDIYLFLAPKIFLKSFSSVYPLLISVFNETLSSKIVPGFYYCGVRGFVFSLVVA